MHSFFDAQFSKNGLSQLQKLRNRLESKLAASTKPDHLSLTQHISLILELHFSSFQLINQIQIYRTKFILLYVLILQIFMEAICCACRFIGRPQTFKATLPVENHNSYYLVCEEGHIRCRECASRNDHEDKFCHFGQSPHPKWANKIECLLHNKDFILLDKLGKHVYQLQANKVKRQIELQNKIKQFQDKKRQFFIGDRERQQQLTQSNINIQICEDDLMSSIGTDIDKLQKDISQITQKIGQEERMYGYFKLVFDSLASATVLAATVLQTITVVSFFIKDQSALALLIIFLAITGLYYLPFLFVILKQVCQENRQNVFRRSLLFVLQLTAIVPLLPILVSLSLPINTLEIINKKQFGQYYFIPKKNPCDYKLNYSLLILKTIEYWIILIKCQTAYREADQQAAFILSFFQVMSLIYLNLRYNNDRQQLEKIRQQHIS